MIVQEQHTDLPDRTDLIRHLASALDDVRESGSLVAVITLKILHLKDLSIEYGYEQSDIVGETFVGRLADCLRSKDFLARISRDEFAVMLPNVKSQAQPIMAINKIQRACAVPINVNGEEIKLQVCFGWSVGPEDAENADKLLRCADVALVEAESTNVDSVRYTTSGVVEKPPVLLLGSRLETAIETGEIQAYYQPIVDIETGEMAGVEMLSRWPSGPLGTSNPDVFVEVAEHSGLVMPLTIWCLNNGLRECGEWQHTLPNLPVSINFSAIALSDPHLPKVVLSALKLWDAQVGRLSVEVTESAIMENPEVCLSILNELHDLGVRIAIDDFGTGYSSLGYLKELPIDILKIDRSFVLNMTENLADRRIVQTVIDLAHNFDLTVVAEGVEDEETLDTLTLMGCQRAQGYHVGEPMVSADLPGWFEQSDWEIFYDPSGSP